MRKHYSLRMGFGLLALLFAVCVTRVSAQPTPPSPVPLPTPFSPIVDNANVIDPETEARLVSIFYNLKDRGKIEYAVLTVDTTGERDIFDFSLAVARGWGIGPKDGEKASFLLVIAIQDRKYFTQVSRHLEGDLPDGLVGQIQRQRLVPAFRQGNYSKGIFDTIQGYVATLAANRGFSVEGIDQSYAIQEQRDEPNLSSICVGIGVIGFILLLLFSASRRGGRGGRGGGSGCLQALFWSALFSGLNSGNRRGSGSHWGGGGFGGGGFGGGGGGFGGGFGGGGDFGGGGAGGSW